MQPSQRPQHFYLDLAGLAARRLQQWALDHRVTLDLRNQDQPAPGLIPSAITATGAQHPVVAWLFSFGARTDFSKNQIPSRFDKHQTREKNHLKSHQIEAKAP